MIIVFGLLATMASTVVLFVAVVVVLPAIAADMTQKQCVQGWNGEPMSTTQTWDAPKRRDNRIDQLAMCNQVSEWGRGKLVKRGRGRVG
jgi:ABC-type protease/lipase transport system fused ATPase/permease subunit